MSVPTLNGQVIGRAHYATRALLERLLAPSGTTFQQSLALNAVADEGGTADREQVLARLTAGLKTDRAAALSVLAELTDAGLLAPSPDAADGVALTPAGRGRQAGIRADVADLTARLYGGLPPEDLAAAARVLTALTARADAELAG
ncbi:MarR family winged helix-turn-helix transcriptional regulator [Kitasatospora sp. MBT63]|uniref:MarR family winged helix-turn-helix transcriptional regulator n=1 Tax=Kitasatospora sp. MBT63 TaxID=1444768 RepID=UPI00053A0C89|nr:MarR family winged helix-turn-helix transcriptional regulator [Kitasatospora sp. MBT63]